MNTNKQHLFISYSRTDSDVVRRIIPKLQRARIPVWLDTEAITPGHPNWEQAIRDAIANAFAVLLVASPDSRQSVYVYGELTVARANNCPIYPIWVNGEEWIDCVPLNMVNYQYIDCRSSVEESGLSELVQTLNAMRDTSGGVVTIGLPTHEKVEVGLAQFGSLFHFLSQILIHYIGDWYEPYTYGNEWLLVNVDTKQVAAPWNLLKYDVNDPLSRMALYESWMGIIPSDVGIENGSFWAVWEASRVGIGGIATNQLPLANRILYQYGPREITSLIQRGCLKVVKPADVNVSSYRFHAVLAMGGILPEPGRTYNRMAYVDTDQICG